LYKASPLGILIVISTGLRGFGKKRLREMELKMPQ